MFVLLFCYYKSVRTVNQPEYMIYGVVLCGLVYGLAFWFSFQTKNDENEMRTGKYQNNLVVETFLIYYLDNLWRKQNKQIVN